MQRELPCRINGSSVQKRRNPPLVVINCVHFATKWSLDYIYYICYSQTGTQSFA